MVLYVVHIYFILCAALVEALWECHNNFSHVRDSPEARTGGVFLS